MTPPIRGRGLRNVHAIQEQGTCRPKSLRKDTGVGTGCRSCETEGSQTWTPAPHPGQRATPLGPEVSALPGGPCPARSNDDLVNGVEELVELDDVRRLVAFQRLLNPPPESRASLEQLPNTVGVLHFWRHRTGPHEAMLVTLMTIARNLAEGEASDQLIAASRRVAGSSPTEWS